MATSVAVTTTAFVTPAARSEVSPVRVYRLRKSFAAVQFRAAGKGRIVFLPEGAELRVVGSSCLCGCLEVLYENGAYSVFKVDLLGPGSVQIGCNSGESRKIETAGANVAIGACA